MYITAVPNRGSPPAILLRESYRQDGQVKTRTLANLSKLPAEAIALLRRSLQGETLLAPQEAFENIASFHHGHVSAVLTAMRRLGLPQLLASRPSRPRQLVLAMVAARLLEPASKLATTRWWQVTTLPAELGVEEADEEDLYAALDWLGQRQAPIEKKLAARHLRNDGLALYDLTSSYFEGTTCSLASLGYNRDGKRGKLQVNYGLLTNPRGIPVSVSVFEGKTGDPKTLLPEVDKLRQQFGIERLALVGDRGMITHKQIDALRPIDGIDWITALRSETIRKLVEGGAIQRGLFDERNLFELTHPDLPGERLVACRNPELARRRASQRSRLLEATARELEKVRRMVTGGRLQGQEPIGKRVRQVLGHYRLGKHYRLQIGEDDFQYRVAEEAIAAELARAATKSPEVAQRRRQRYARHRQAIDQQLEHLRQRIQRGRLYGKEHIGVRVGKVLNKYKVGKHFQLHIEEDRFDFEIDPEKVQAEAALDGLYVVRTSLPKETLDAAETVLSYKLLGSVERAFRSFKTMDLNVRPIHHRLADRVRAHIFLCLLAYYVLWHMLEAWRPLLFADEDLEAKKTRDPVAPARRSQEALRKVHSRTLEDGTEVHSFQTLLKLLSSITRNLCRVRSAGPEAATFEILTTPSAKQQRAFDLLETIGV